SDAAKTRSPVQGARTSDDRGSVFCAVLSDAAFDRGPPNGSFARKKGSPGGRGLPGAGGTRSGETFFLIGLGYPCRPTRTRTSRPHLIVEDSADPAHSLQALT